MVRGKIVNAGLAMLFMLTLGCAEPVIANSSTIKQTTTLEQRINPKLKINSFDERINDFFENPSKVFKEDSIPQGFKAIVLSNLAEGITNNYLKGNISIEQARSTIDKVVETALSKRVSPFGQPIQKTPYFGDHGLYLSHLNIILGAYKRVTGDDKYAGINTRISMHLRHKTKKENVIRSYPSQSYRWPADQTATLYSLYLFDQNYDVQVSKEPIEQWLKFMKENATDKKTGLHISEITGSERGKYPRGCALSWSIRYMGKFAPEEAKGLWKQYKKHFKVNYGLIAGFREYPKGVNYPADADSGPIIRGVGVAASALAVGASRSVRDHTTKGQISFLENLTMLGVSVLDKPFLNRMSKGILAESIRLNAETITDWYK